MIHLESFRNKVNTSLSVAKINIFFSTTEVLQTVMLRDGASLRVFTSAFISFSQLSRSRGLSTLKLLKLSCGFVVSSQNFQK